MFGIDGYLRHFNALRPRRGLTSLRRSWTTSQTKALMTPGCASIREAGVRSGMPRLSIQDLTNAGHKPATPEDCRLVTICDGEVYNSLPLQTEIEQEGNGPQWIDLGLQPSPSE